MSDDSGRGRVRVEEGQKRVRALLGGEVVADTRRPSLVWEVPYYPTYYFPVADVTDGVLVASETTSHSPSRGDAQHFDVRVGERVALDAALRYPASPIDELRGLVRLEWAAMDLWLEEDEEVFVHPRSPYTRIDVLASSRRVRVEIDGVVVAESDRPHILFETGLPPRYYLPITDVALERLRPSSTETHCPYKGTARYWSIDLGDRVVDDALWTYKTPLAESQKIAGLVAFYNERVDLFVDGELAARPRTVFSRTSPR